MHDASGKDNDLFRIVVVIRKCYSDLASALYKKIFKTLAVTYIN